MERRGELYERGVRHALACGARVRGRSVRRWRSREWLRRERTCPRRCTPDRKARE
ncbi:hypothetical protein SF06_07020 [Pseudomonas flexibilis]|nr:hypothetical protein SF06_07020 [Pseudomonas flexibilis]